MVSVEIRVPNWLDRICVWPVVMYRRWKYGYPYRQIYLGEGEYTIVDPDVYYRLGNYKWSACGSDGRIYAARILRKTVFGRIRTEYLHRNIMNHPAGLLVDHKNRNRQDNRIDNLRSATHSQNQCNKQKKKNTTSRFIGVYKDKQSGRWVSKIRSKEKRIALGSFDSEIEAALAYDAAAKKYHGEFAHLNFPQENFPARCEAPHV